MLALVTHFCVQLLLEGGATFVSEHSKNFKKKSTWVASLEKRFETTLSPSSPLVQWGVRHCGWSPTRYTILEDGLTRDRNCEDVSKEVRSPIWEKQEVSQLMVESALDGQDVVDRRAHCGNAVRQKAGRTVTRTREQEVVQGFVCAGGSHVEPNLNLLAAVQAPRRVYLTRGIVKRFGPMGAEHVLGEVARTPTSAEPGQKIVWQRTLKHRHALEQKRKSRTDRW